jgi:hypothetical protein|tara:strand:- start:2212 stop:2343 length:132 start_codon:yes stop_codon:yes gene_type:complete
MLRAAEKALQDFAARSAIDERGFSGVFMPNLCAVPAEGLGILA